MAKVQKDQGIQNSRSMLDQKTGSMLDKKTNEDFNSEHPYHNDSGLKKDSPAPDNMNMGTNAKQTVDKKIVAIKTKKMQQ